MEIGRYYELVSSGKQENPLATLTGPIAANLKEAVDIATQAHSKIEINIHTLSNRKKIAEIAERFHKKADTLTPRVKHSLELLANRDVVVIESAHQPSLFPYSGTIIKPVLVHVIAEALRTQGLPVVELFGLLDTDDIKTGWHRRTHLPDLNSKDGILVIRKDVSSKKLIFNAVPAPELKEITAWKDMLVNWVRQNRKAINRIAGEEVITGAKERIFFERIKQIFGLWNDIQAHADSYGSFNSIFLTQVVNSYWDYPTLFVPYSLSIAVFEKEIGTLIENGGRYAESYNKYRDSIKRFVTINFTEIAQNHVPFWYICNCGAKVGLFKENGTLKGSCENCGMKLALDTVEINIYSMKLTPQAVSRHLTFFEGLKPDAYISGWGAMPFTLVAKGIAEDFNMHFPPIIPFRINEKYNGIGQLKPILELERRVLSPLEIEKEIERLASIADKLREEGRYKDYKKLKQELRDLKAIKNALDCYPSILDYWVNFGIRKTRDNWEQFIKAHNFWDETTISCLSNEKC
jgi:hypothetical protein